MAEDTKDTPNTNEEVNQKPAPAGDPKGSKQPEENIEEVKVMAALAYVLFFIPLLTHPNSRFGKFHANQGLLLLIFALGGQLVGWMLSIVLIGFLILPIVYIASLVFFIMGLINALNKEMKRLPLIGQFDLIK